MSSNAAHGTALRDAWALCRLDGGRGERRGREQVQRNRATRFAYRFINVEINSS